jgi:NAD dependent epimerase/dehydratase family enzyme
VRLIRSAGTRRGDTVQWDPATRTVDAAGLEGADAVVHLAGENIAGRWTAAEERASAPAGSRGHSSSCRP